MTQVATSTGVDPQRIDLYRDLLRKMLLIRRFEEKCAESYALGRIGGFCHLYIGQEAVAVGAIGALRDDDYIMASYRDHGHALARGTPPRAVMAELYGRKPGCSAGKGGSMHLFDASRNFLGGHAIVGGHVPLATGAGFAIKYRDTDQVSVCFFGEAAVNNGAFHEALNMAAIWRLPVIYLVENNRYGMGTAMERASAIYDVATRSCSYDMNSERVDGMDVLAVHDVTSRLAALAREQKLPTLLEARTYRFMGHSMSDPIHGHYRSKEEVEEQKKLDPIARLFHQLRSEGLMGQEEFEEMDRAVQAEVDDAARFAEEAEDPELDELYTDVYRD